MSVSYLFPPEDEVCRIPAVPVSERPRRDTKAVGDRSELEVAVVMARNGYIVSKPIADSYRYDLIADDGDALYRVQVKTGRLTAGSIRVACCSTHSNRGRIYQRSYRGQIDYLAVFCPQTDGVYLIPEAEIPDATMNLRVAPTVNRQDRHIRWAARYKLA